jgi:transcriptional regulator with PAS, ATPase and Fis domain
VIKKHKEMDKSITNVIPDWAKDMNCAVTVCDADCNIIYMNSKSRATFAKRGDLIGKNLLDCHNERSQQIIRHLLDTGGYNCYTIQKGGLRKMIYQTAWRDEQGAVAGLVEISMVIPEDMPHYIRD